MFAFDLRWLLFTLLLIVVTAIFLTVWLSHRRRRRGVLVDLKGVAAALERDAELRRHTLVVHYHDLCTAPAEALRRVYDHCALAVDDARLAEQAARLAFPTYYKAGFTEAEAAVIAEETAATVARLRALA